MHLGKLCKYAGDCPVYQNKNKRMKKPFFMVQKCVLQPGSKRME